MIQEINLYQPELKSATSVLLPRLALLWLLSIAFIGAYAGLQTWKLYQQRQDASLVQAQRDETTAAIEQHRRQSASPEQTTLANKKVQLLAELEVRQKLLQQVLKEGGSNQTGFSEYLSGFARSHVDGIWLNYIRLAAGGRDVTLQGSARSERLVPVLLQRFSQEKIFSGLAFRQVQISREESVSDPLHFILRSEVAP